MHVQEVPRSQETGILTTLALCERKMINVHILFFGVCP